MTSCNRAVLLTQCCWLCRSFGGVVPLAEQDAVAEEGDAPLVPTSAS
jgi:hypothetical protein